MPRTNFQELLDAGAHFGHLARKWNPKMAPYIFIERNGIHIIDLHKSIVKIDEAAQMMKELARSGRKILFVATKKQAKDIIAGRKIDPSFYPVIYGADEADDWTNPAVWKKANRRETKNPPSVCGRMAKVTASVAAAATPR